MAVPSRSRSSTRKLRASTVLWFEMPGRWKVPRVHGIGEELLRIVSPELAHGGIGLHHRVHQLSIAALDLADVGRHDPVSVLVELPLAAPGPPRAGGSHRLPASVPLLHPAAPPPPP